MLTSMNQLKTTLTMICSSWTGWYCRRSRTGCNMMNMRFITKVNPPSVGVNRRLSTYGTLEIGEVPSAALVISATPNELISTPIKK